MVDLKLNRPIYLARRDKYYLLAVNHLCEDFLAYPIDKSCEYIGFVLDILKFTRKQSVCSLRGKDIDLTESDFLKSLELIIEALDSAGVVLKHNRIIHDKNSFLNRFSGNFILPESNSEFLMDIVSKIIEHIRLFVFRLTDRFEELRKKCFESLSDEDKIRYSMMFDHEETIWKIK